MINLRSPRPLGREVIVLIGAGRGGTTLLYKLLSLHRDVAYLSNYQSRLPGWPQLARIQRVFANRHDLKRMTWFKPEGGAYLTTRRQFLHSLVPAPVECEPLYAHCGVPLTPDLTLAPDERACARLASAFDAVRRHAGSTVLVTKRTANNRRIPWIERAFPSARYINLMRDGRAVASSLLKVDWWSEHVLFWAGKSPSQLVAEGRDELELAARNWVEETAMIEQALSGVPAQRVHNVRYEDLVADPERVLSSIMAFMGVDAADDPPFLRQISNLGLKPAGPPGDRLWTPVQRASVESIQRDRLNSLGYCN